MPSFFRITQLECVMLKQLCLGSVFIWRCAPPFAERKFREADCLFRRAVRFELTRFGQSLEAHPLSTWAQVPPNPARKKGSSDSRGGRREPDEVGQGHGEVHSGVSSE
jgi:hypothetical protein